ncbi:202_t:CDS:2 [Gigaspora margarita]|uniref:202_t:CDS:1 n=1 Tax=Gigaspora margarita TaxID=4874 RepID=A0ABN7VTI2_GIGMA|nr:202_t:CDS:2 [Gigaspora margarita]
MIFFYIALDGWTSPKGLFRDHQTGNFIANKISDIIEKIGSYRFAAVVMDNGSNIRVAQQSINYNYSHILSVHCIAHALNLLSANLVKNTSIKEILKQANMLVSFIQKSHLASRVLQDTISSMNIRANSIIRVRPAIDKILEEQPNIFTNREVFKIVNDENENFYTSCRRIALIFEPIKQVITLLESHIASLADCFLGIVHLAFAFKRISISNNFRFLAIIAFNHRYQEFDISPYVLTYFLHPNYQSHGLQKGKFCEICELAVNYYKGLHHSEKECRELVGQLIKYKANITLWDLEYSSNLTPPLWWGVIEDEYMHLQELAKTMFAIIPSQASYEQNFSILKWFSERRHTWLQVSRLESMAQIYSFYVSNVKKELSFCNNNFVEMELRNSVFNETIFAEINSPNLSEDNNEVDNKVDNKVEFENLIVNEITMALQDWVDLLDPIFGLNNSQEETVLSEKEINMEFETRSLV